MAIKYNIFNNNSLFNRAGMEHEVFYDKKDNCFIARASNARKLKRLVQTPYVESFRREIWKEFWKSLDDESRALAESFDEMLEANLIECNEKDGEKYYSVTKKGSLVARELHSDILSSILDKSLEAAFRYLDFKKRKIEARCSSERRADGRFDLTCTLYEKKEKIFETTIVVDTENRMERMKEQYMERPDVIYRGVTALLTGRMSYLFS